MKSFNLHLGSSALAGSWLAENVYPNLSGVGGAAKLKAVIGALLTIVLLAAVLMLILSAVGWAISSNTGNAQAANRARAGVWVSLGVATLAGLCLPWLNFLLDIGDRV